MQLSKLFTVSAISSAIVSATPISVIRDSVSPFPQCGFVRFNADDLWMVGVYTSSKCETIWKERKPNYYRIDRAGCSCQFYSSKESCEREDAVPSWSGPERIEKPFEGEKPSHVRCVPK
ncbi:hypothetical protein DM02DRAFT_689110 [Periconia macrospinosa]|uniref:Uncharacterized protein n=1 Tax=Periconia macrospinosa TaxID=97972 RepID=A0A2V1DCX6_9PLEO|nr:hypothetical protein DM02DRAFT_689110 [Periconia macrospinosa]